MSQTLTKDINGRFLKGKRYSINTEFKKGQHWRKVQIFRDKTWLNNEYIIKGRTASNIAKEFNVTAHAILFWLKKHNILRRTMAQTRKLKYWGCSGINNPMYGKNGAFSPNFGKKRSEETRSKLRKARKNRITKESAKIKLRNRKFSEETRQKMHNTAIKINKKPPIMRGEKNPNWLGGKSFEPYTAEFSKDLKLNIKQRDIYTCQLCDRTLTSDKLNIHHIDYSKKNNNFNNLVTLCKKCHTKTNFNREYWIKEFKNREDLNENLSAKCI